MRQLAILCVGALAALAAPSAAQADAVIDWNLHAQSTILAPGPTSHASTLDFAMVHGAIYDAVNAIDRRYQPYLDVPASAVRRPRTWPRPLAAGAQAAAAMLAARANDGRLPPGTPYPFPQGTRPGEWRVSPPLTAVDPAWWVGNVRPFLIPNARWFLSDGLPALASGAYAKDFKEVKRLGALDTPDRTADQTMAAIFWQANPLGLYSGVMRDLSARYELSSAQNARLFGMVTLAAADSAIVCWKDKYTRKLVAADRRHPPRRQRRQPGHQGRPRLAAAVRPGDADHAAAGDAELPRPSVRPQLRDQRRGGSAAELLRRDRIAFDVRSPRFPGRPRHFDRFSDLLVEIIEARIRGGIHFRTADVQGAGIGENVARWERRFYFRRR